MQDNENQLCEEDKGICDKPPQSFFSKKTLKGPSNIAKYGIKEDWSCLIGKHLSKNTRSLWATNKIRARM